MNAFIGFFNPQQFNGVLRDVDPGGIEKIHRYSPKHHGVLNHIPGGAGNVRDNGAVFFDQPVHETGFSDIRAADNG